MGVIFVADGAGDFRLASKSMRETLKKACLPIRVDPFIWSHGRGRIFKDELHYHYARAQGGRLASEIQAFQQTHPGEKVYLVGHSAGSAVALAAAEALPPFSLESIALLAPSLSANYDLRPALRSVRGHIDVYYSCNDWVYLGVFTEILGTPDRGHSPSSGRVGFRAITNCAEDDWLYSKLRQHPWHHRDLTTGNCGGHYGAYQEGYLRTLVLPMLFDGQPNIPPIPLTPDEELPPPRRVP